LEVGSSLAQDGAKSGVGARARHSKLQLAFDASVPRTMMRTPRCHAARLPVGAGHRFFYAPLVLDTY
ncbi:MAG: hypothetical protein M3082_10960, partial [Candidatus Dormibacteraeota bacterium]|nr:hypothetical protein [Candidatus Dormibacteraeota bacterium]